MTKSLEAKPVLQWMAILNVTPDSFSEQEACLPHSGIPTPEVIKACIAKAHYQIQAGASVVDVGAESTRPYAAMVPDTEELARLVPVLKALRATFPEVLVSLDTRKPLVAQTVLTEGLADWVNDVSGGLYHQQHTQNPTPSMFQVLASYYHQASEAQKARFRYVLTHSQGTPQTMQQQPTYPEGKCCETVAMALAEQACTWAKTYHLPLEALYFDVGFGFGKTFHHNLNLLQGFKQMAERITTYLEDVNVLHGQTLINYQEAFPWLVGVSRKSMLVGAYPQGNVPAPASPQRETLAVAAHTLAWQQGVRWFRVHDVAYHAPIGHFLEAL